MNRYLQTALLAVLFPAVALLPNLSLASHTGTHQVIDGVSIYIGMMSVEEIGTQQNARNPEAQMHGGVAYGAHRDHLVVALFDSRTGKRITDARVSGTVRELGRAGKTKNLEAMTIADTVTWGNYFDLPNRGVYRVVLQVLRPTASQAIEAKFIHRHD